MTTPSSFAHAMPFGAEVGADGTRFRVWAPGVPTLRLALPDKAEELEMQAGDGGWFELRTDAAPAGTRYQLLLPDGLRVPDPVSRFQPEDVHGPSEVIDPRSYRWQQAGWRGRPWEEVVLYELHTGCFSDEGSFDGLRRRLDHLVSLGVTAVELMPVADFPGTRGWGYDGVLMYAPDSSYGRPEDLKRLIDEAHARGLMVFLDVVYNHFGPDGNYLYVYARDFFSSADKTPWGEAIDYSRRPVRDFAINNVLYWLEEYRFDGLRFDAVDRIIDHTDPHLLTEIAATVRSRITDRHVHLVLENDANQAHRLERGEDGAVGRYSAQWNDDIHHVYQHLLTGDEGGYYADYLDRPNHHLARALATGFVYQGEPSAYREGERRGEPSGHLPPTAFVSFLQNHDQVGNRAFGERIGDLAEPGPVMVVHAVLLLAPAIPLLFMGEEWGAKQPFCYFTDFHDALADSVREGRRREFQKFPAFASEEARAKIPDPNAEATFLSSRLDWGVLGKPDHAAWLEYVSGLLRLRHAEIIPRLEGMTGPAEETTWGETALAVRWRMGDGSRLVLVANLGPAEVPFESELPPGDLLFETRSDLVQILDRGRLPAWSVLWLLDPAS